MYGVRRPCSDPPFVVPPVLRSPRLSSARPPIAAHVELGRERGVLCNCKSRRHIRGDRDRDDKNEVVVLDVRSVLTF